MEMKKEVSEYFKIIGKKGGESRSERKVSASKENGRKGGRPKKEKLYKDKRNSKENE